MIRIFIWVLLLFGGGVLAVWLDARWFPGLFSNLYFHIITFVVGFFVFRLVIRASRNTGKLLARLGREGTVPRLETNKLVTTDIYFCMRHPMYLGLLFFPLAFALILGSPTFILMIAPAEAVAIILLVKLVEEPQAVRKFGPAYEDYMRDVPFFSLKRECLKRLFGKGNSTVHSSKR